MINFMKRFRYLLATMVVLYLMTIVFAFASVPVNTVAHYKVSSMGLNIGDVTTTQHMTEESGVTSLKFETRTAVKASFLWMGYHQ